MSEAEKKNKIFHFGAISPTQRATRRRRVRKERKKERTKGFPTRSGEMRRIPTRWPIFWGEEKTNGIFALELQGP